MNVEIYPFAKRVLSHFTHLWGPFTNTFKGGGLMKKKGDPYNFGGLKRGEGLKKIMLNLPLKIESKMIFCGVDAYISWGKRGP